jgi:hypothetical protein
VGVIQSDADMTVDRISLGEVVVKHRPDRGQG